VNHARQVSAKGVSRRWAVVEVGLIFLLLFVLAGNAPPDVNEAHYLAKAKHYWDPSWCPNDFFLVSADAHTVFYWVFGWLTRLLPLAAVAWVGRVVTWLLLAWSWRRLSVAVVPGRMVALLTAGLLAGLVRWGHMAGEWIVGGIEAKSFAYVLVFLGLEAVTRGRWRAVWLLLGAATSFHVLVGGWSVVAALVAWFVARAERPGWRATFPWLIVGGLLALPGLVPALALTWGTDAATVREANQIYVFERLHHHLVFHRLGTVYIVRFAVLVGAWFVLLRFSNVTDASRRLQAFVLGAVLISAGGVLVDQVAVWLGVAGQWFGLENLYNRPLIAAILRYYWFRLADVMVPVGVVFAAVLLLQHRMRFRPGSGQYWLAGAILLVVLLAGEAALQRSRDARPRAVAQPMSGHATTQRQLDQRYLAWRATCFWIKTHTPPDALFLTPRHQQTFKWYAERSEVVVWKDVPQDAGGLLEWRRRIREIYPREVEESGLVAHGDAGLLELSRSYGCQYIVIDRTFSSRRLSLRRVFPRLRTPGHPYEIYRVPPPAKWSHAAP